MAGVSTSAEAAVSAESARTGASAPHLSVAAPHETAGAGMAPTNGAATINPDWPDGVVWPEDKVPGPDGMPAFDSARSDGKATIYAVADNRVPGNLVINLPLTDIDKNPFQTRYVDDNDALEDLAESIKVNGVVQPIVVRPSEDEEGRYVLILGERRLHASTQDRK